MSNASEIRGYYKELLEDFKEHSRAELFSYAKRKNPEANYTESMLNWALKTLIDESDNYVCTSRNIYKYVLNIHLYNLEAMLKEMVDEVEGINVNPFLFIECQRQKNDIYKMKKIQECIKIIKETIV